jgi:hypothetical protein
MTGGKSMSEPYKTFIDLSLEGKVPLEKIDDYVDAWHNKPGGESLCEYLGMKEPEYSLWVRDPDALAYINKARREKRSLFRLINDEYRQLSKISTPVKRLEAKRLQEWLQQEGALKRVAE